MRNLTLKKLSTIREPDEYILEIRKFIEESELTLQRDTSLILWGEMKDGILKVCGRKQGDGPYAY